MGWAGIREASCELFMGPFLGRFYFLLGLAGTKPNSASKERCLGKS